MPVDTITIYMQPSIDLGNEDEVVENLYIQD